MKFSSDIDIDVADRDKILSFFEHINATIIRDGKDSKHNTGAYFTNIPINPYTGRSSLDYQEAETRGYLKIDILNVGLYKQVKSEQHLQELIQQEPPWDRLYDPSFCSQLIHIGSHYDTLIQMPEAVNTIPRLAMFLAVIRPAKRHLIGRTWREVSETIWDKSDGGYAFKRSHSISYAHLVVVNMNLLNQVYELK